MSRQKGFKHTQKTKDKLAKYAREQKRFYVKYKSNLITPNRFLNLGAYSILVITDRSGRLWNTKVDNEDLDFISKYQWCIRRPSKKSTRVPHYYIIGAGSKLIYLHRFIMEAKRGQIVDHINGDTMDNRRKNLRFVTPSQHSQNRITLGINRHSKYRNKWCARIGVANHYVYLGIFDDKETALLARRNAEKKYWGEYSRNLQNANT